MKQLTTNEIKVLAILNDRKRLYGTEIAERLHDIDDRFRLGSLYNVLIRLEKLGLIESFAEGPKEENTNMLRNVHRRKYYEVTNKGQEMLSMEAMSILAVMKGLFRKLQQT